MNMSDHWKTLTRMLGAPDAAEPPKKAAPLPPSPPSASSPAPKPTQPAETSRPARAARNTELSPPELLEDRSKTESADLLDDLIQVPERQSLPGFGTEADPSKDASWDELVQDLGVQPAARPAASSPEAAPPAKSAKPAAKAKSESKSRSRPKPKGRQRPASGFGSGLIENDEQEVIEEDLAVADDLDVTSPPPSAKVEIIDFDAEPESPSELPRRQAESSAEDSGTADDDDLFSGFKGRPSRRGRAKPAARETDSPRARQSETDEPRRRPEREQGPGEDFKPRERAEHGRPEGGRPERKRSDRDRDEPRNEEARPARVRETSKETAPDAEADFDASPRSGGKEESEPRGRGRRGRRRGQRQRISEGVEEDLEQPVSADPGRRVEVDEDTDAEDRMTVDQDDVGVQHSLERIEQSEGEDEAPRRRRRRRRGRGRGGRGEAASGETTTGEPPKDSSPAAEARANEPKGPAIDAVFDDDHEDAEEVTELRRGRRRRPRRGGGDRSESVERPKRRPLDDDSNDADGEVEYIVEDADGETRRERDVTTWLETVDILISSNMSGRKNDSRGRGRQRSGGGGSSRRRD